MKERTVAAAKLGQGGVKIYDAKGGYIRTIGAGDAVKADCNGSGVAVTHKSGHLKLYDVKGRYIRTI